MDVRLPPEFARFLAYLHRNERRAPKTIATRTTALRHLTQWCATHGVDPIAATEADLITWQASLNHADATVASYTTGVRRVYRWLSSRAGGMAIPHDPARDLPSVRVVIPQQAAITDDDLVMALRTAEAADPRVYMWLLLEAGTGIRPCQIASLTRQRVRYQESGRAELTVVGKGRTQPVVAGPDIAAELRRWTLGTQGPLWLNAAGRPVTAWNIVRCVNRHLRELGIDATSHSLRRWFGKHAHRLTGNDVRTVQELLGHADPRTTMRYIPVSEQGVANVADLLSERLTRRRRSAS